MSKHTDHHRWRPGRFCLLFIFSFLFYFAHAQTRITGKVSSPDGKPFFGATVAVKNTNIATSTADDGSFSLNVPDPNGTLVISYVGYETQEVTIPSLNGGPAMISMIALPNSLNEVVVTGYSAQRRKDITGAVAVVNVADLKSIPSSDATAQLQGKASGVSVVTTGIPGSSSKVRIRGLGSFNNNSPMYVVGGVKRL